MRKLPVLLSCAVVIGVAALVANSHAAPDAAPATPPAAAPAAAPTTTPTTTTAPAGGTKVAWADMSKGQKTKYMKTVVMPRMKEVFQAFDAKEFKTFNCVTCHGKNPEKRKFKMPGPDVRHLPGTPEAFQAMMAKEPTWPKWVEFMSKKVQPAMADLLQMKVFDHKNPQAGGFSCQACHMIDKS
jgi:mono/diheme cytochrome c family protein